MINKIIELIKKYREIVSYLIVGGLTTVVSMAVFYISVWTFLDGNNPFQLQVANVLSWIAGVSFAYVTNRKYVFESKNANVLQELSKFVGARVVTLLQDMAVMFILTSLLSVNYNFAKIFSAVLVVIINYVLSKVFVFRAESQKEE